LYGQARTHSQPAERRDQLPWASILAYRNLLVKLVEGQVGTARPERQLHDQCAVGQEANAEHPHIDMYIESNRI